MSRALLRNIYGWQKAIKTKEMTENSRTSNDYRFSYMLDFILKPGWKLEYQDNASLLKFKVHLSPKIFLRSNFCEEMFGFG